MFRMHSRLIAHRPGLVRRGRMQGFLKFPFPFTPGARFMDQNVDVNGPARHTAMQVVPDRISDEARTDPDRLPAHIAECAKRVRMPR